MLSLSILCFTSPAHGMEGVLRERYASVYSDINSAFQGVLPEEAIGRIALHSHQYRDTFSEIASDEESHEGIRTSHQAAVQGRILLQQFDGDAIKVVMSLLDQHPPIDLDLMEYLIGFIPDLTSLYVADIFTGRRVMAAVAGSLTATSPARHKDLLYRLITDGGFSPSAQDINEKTLLQITHAVPDVGATLIRLGADLPLTFNQLDADGRSSLRELQAVVGLVWSYLSHQLSVVEHDIHLGFPKKLPSGVVGYITRSSHQYRGKIHSLLDSVADAAARFEGKRAPMSRTTHIYDQATHVHMITILASLCLDLQALEPTTQ